MKRKLTLEQRVARLERMASKNESEFSQESVNLGGFSWTKIGELNGYSLYLCDDIVKEMYFTDLSSETDEWKNSGIRKWLNSDFYRTLTPEERSSIISYNGDRLFLLSEDEYKKFEGNIPRVDGWWWLRSPGTDSYSTASVYRHEVKDSTSDLDEIGVRPAVLLD